jgi:hypothetical protein
LPPRPPSPPWPPSSSSSWTPAGLRLTAGAR